MKSRTLPTALDGRSAHIQHVTLAQAVAGWMFRGDLECSHAALAKLPSDALHKVSVAMAALSTLADEIAGERSR